jgi:hypothetical protein
LTGSGEFGGVPGILALLDDPQRPKIPFLTGAGALLFSVSSLLSSSIICSLSSVVIFSSLRVTKHHFTGNQHDAE